MKKEEILIERDKLCRYKIVHPCPGLISDYEHLIGKRADVCIPGTGLVYIFGVSIRKISIETGYLTPWRYVRNRLTVHYLAQGDRPCYCEQAPLSDLRNIRSRTKEETDLWLEGVGGVR